jgi:hypothetical protein
LETMWKQVSGLAFYFLFLFNVGLFGTYGMCLMQAKVFAQQTDDRLLIDISMAKIHNKGLIEANGI